MVEEKDDLFAYFNNLEKSYMVDGTLARKNLPKKSEEVSKMTIRKVSSKRYDIVPQSEQTPKKVAKKQVAKIIEIETQKDTARVEPIKVADRQKEEKRIEKLAERERKKEEKAREKRVLKLYKQLNKENLKRYKLQDIQEEKEEQRLEDEVYKKRITPRKKRNIISRIRNIDKYDSGEYEIEEEHVLRYKNGQANISDIDYDWEDIQKYEDARDDVALRRGWTAFKVALAGVALVGALFACKYVANEAKNTWEKVTARPTEITSVIDLDEEQRETLEQKVQAFQNDVLERDGYVFDYLSHDELEEGYFKIVNFEKRLNDRNFTSSSFSLKDQEFLDKILQESLGLDTFNSLSLEKKRDYKQLAFEALFDAQPKYFNEDGGTSIRNPIVIDHLAARDKAQQNGYNMQLKVNNTRKETVKNLGMLLHRTRTMTVSDLEGIDLEDGGQAFLQSFLKDVIGDSYDEMKDSDKRDFLQVAYEMLPSGIKGFYIQNPIGVDRQMNNDFER